MFFLSSVCFFFSRREIQHTQESNQQEKAETGRQETTSGLKEETFHITSMDLQWMQHEPPPHLGTTRLPSVTLVKCNQSGSKRTSLGFTSPSGSYQTGPENYAASDSGKPILVFHTMPFFFFLSISIL